MGNIQLIPVPATNHENASAVPTKNPRKLADLLNDMVLVISFSLRPARGATTFPMRFGGLMWEALSFTLHSYLSPSKPSIIPIPQNYKGGSAFSVLPV